MDIDFLSLALDELKKVGVQYFQPRIFLCNFDYKDDFIRDKPNADMLFLSWVNVSSVVWKNSYLITSPLLIQGETWKSALEVANPKYIAHFTDNRTCVPITETPNNYSCISDSGHYGTYVYVRNDLI